MPGRGKNYVPADWPYKVGEATEVGSKAPRYSRTGRLIVDREPTTAQLKMMARALDNENVIPPKSDRRALKGLVARRFAEVLDDGSAKLTSRGVVRARKHVKAEKLRMRDRTRAYRARRDPERAEQARREAFERVMASGKVPPDVAVY